VGRFLNILLGLKPFCSHRLQGAARPGAEEGHEHFGFMVIEPSALSILVVKFSPFDRTGFLSPP
jgi:hypothetical protein